MSRTETPLFQVDAFADQAFRGNPAAVCLLDEAADAKWMQNVAAEMNLSETAFLVENGGGFDLRWFTPAVEVSLCGHATLASAHVLWETGRLGGEEAAVFSTKSGKLEARREADRIELDFPVHLSVPAGLPGSVASMLGVSARSVEHLPAQPLGEGTYIVELDSEDAVRRLQPNLAPIRAPGSPGVIVTARGSGEFDFVSRFFVPCAGIDEDPVTGSAHCCLAPFWSERLGKSRMTGFQASARGGVVGVELAGERVKLTGHAVTTLRGALLC